MEQERTAVLERLFEAAKEWRSTRLMVRVMRLNPQRVGPGGLAEATQAEGRALSELAKIVDDAATLEEEFAI